MKIVRYNPNSGIDIDIQGKLNEDFGNIIFKTKNIPDFFNLNWIYNKEIYPISDEVQNIKSFNKYNFKFMKSRFKKEGPFELTFILDYQGDIKDKYRIIL